jgi:phosphopantothenoylcysteine synthetase/decarboxylase
MSKTPSIHIFGGGTLSHIRTHFAITAAAYGETARALHALLAKKNISSTLHLTKMACMGKSDLETNGDIRKRTEEILADPASKVIIFNVAVTDFDGQIGDVPSGKYAERLKSRDETHLPVILKPADKIVPLIKQKRPDIFLVAFKTTAGADDQDQLARGTKLLNDSQADLVLANDTKTRRNVLIAKGGAILCDTKDRALALQVIADAVAAHVNPAAPQVKKAHGPKNIH